MLPSVRSYEDARRAFRWHVPEAFNAAADSLDRQCRPGADPDRTALIAPGPDGAVAHFSYGELKRLSDALAAALAKLMVEPGATVATLLPQGAEIALTALATLKAGAAIAPFDAAWPAETLARAVALAKPRVVVADRKSLAAARAVLPADAALVCVHAPDDGARDFWELLRAAPEAAVAVATGADEPAFLVLTQGRTATPRLIRHAHRAVLGHLPALEMVFDGVPRPGDLIWPALRPSHPAGLISGLFGPWLLGVPVLAMGLPETPAEAEDRIARVARHGVRLALFTPAAIAGLALFPEPRAHYTFSLRAAACIGGRPAGDADAWCRADLGIPLGHIYGETETGPVAASHAAWYDSAGQGALGRAVPGVTLAVVDADGDPISSGGVGRLAVAREHPGLCLGCVDSHQALARWAREKYVGRWLLADDLVTLTEDGDLAFVAKADDVLAHGPAGFLPDDVERVLERHRTVAAAAILAEGDGDVAAAVALKPGVPRGDAAAEALLAADILAAAGASLAPYAVPNRVVFVEAIPRTDEGRVHRARLRALFAQAAAGSK